MAGFGLALDRRPATARPRAVVAAGLVGLVGAGGLVALQLGSEASSTDDSVARERAAAAYAKLPLRFEENRGQTAAQVKYVSRGAGYALFLTPREAVISLTRAVPGRADPLRLPEPAPETVGASVRMRLLGGNPRPRVEAAGRLQGSTNHLRGDRSQWRTGVPGFSRVRYSQAYPGIDLVYHGRQGELEYDFVVAPGADPGKVALGFRGTESLRVDRGGNLIASTRAGDLRQARPVIYQRVAGGRRPVSGGYVLDGNRVTFRVGRYDRSRPLVIDPVLAYATYVGGGGEEINKDIAVGDDGSAYVTGLTRSDNFPTTPGSHDVQRSEMDAFVTKLNPQGSALVYSTYLGGNGDDIGEGIAVDSGGRAYVTGSATSASTNFPTTAGAFDTTMGGGDAFLTVLNAQGSGLAYSTLLGGSTPYDPSLPPEETADAGNEVAVDAAGLAYVTGRACSTNFPTKAPAPGPYDAGHNGTCDAFVSKLNPGLSGVASLVASTYLGGGEFEVGTSIALGSTGPYVTGLTSSTNFPVPGTPEQATLGGAADAFVSTLNVNLSSLAYSTYLGGGEFDVPGGIDVDGAGNAYLMGTTASPDFPTASPLQPALGGGDDLFVAKLAPNASGLAYSTYLGGAGTEGNGEIAVDSGGTVHVGGSSDAETLFGPSPVAPRGDSADPFLVKLNPAGSARTFGTYLGGGASEDLGDVAVALGPSGTTYLAGTTNSTDFPTQAPLQAQSAGTGVPTRSDVFVAKIGADAPGAPRVTGLSPRSGPAGTSVVIRGSGFTGATSVRFGGVPAASFTVNSPVQITAVSPPHAEGGAVVSVAKPSGTSAPNPIARFAYAEGRWSPTGALPAGGAGAAVRLANGKVLTVLAESASLYDPATGTWTPTGGMNQPRTGSTLTRLADGRVVALGGCCHQDDGSMIATAEIYDPATGTWSEAGELAVSRQAHTATLLSNGKVLVAGGDDATFTVTPAAELYDPASESSGPAEDLGEERADHTATALRGPACSGASPPSYCGRVLVVGGRNLDDMGQTQPIDTAELYNPATGTWSPTGVLGFPRQNHSATQLADGRVLSAGGRNRFLSVNFAELYSPATGTWVPTSGLMRYRRDNHAAVLLPSGKVLLAGGLDGVVVWNTAELFNPASNRFSSAGIMTRHRGGIDNDPIGLLLGNGKALVAAGGSAASSELFTPSGASRPPVTALDRLAPSVSRFRLTRRRFRVGRRATPRVAQTRRRTRAGSAFVYRLSEAAHVRIVIQRRLRGRRVGGRCRKATRTRRNRPRCIRYVRVGTLRRSGRSGPNRHTFSGRIGRRKLRPGRYRALLTATDSSNNRSRTRRAGFRVVRR